MKLYAAFDLHSSNSYLAIIDEEGQRLLSKKFANDPQQILTALSPHRKKLAGIAVESTYNWYWLVDMLMERGYEVHLANPAAIQKYKGLKHTDDRHDANWLAEMLRLGILPEGYKEERSLRDLLRKREGIILGSWSHHGVTKFSVLTLRIRRCPCLTRGVLGSSFVVEKSSLFPFCTIMPGLY